MSGPNNDASEHGLDVRAARRFYISPRICFYVAVLPYSPTLSLRDRGLLGPEYTFSPVRGGQRYNIPRERLDVPFEGVHGCEHQVQGIPQSSSFGKVAELNEHLVVVAHLFVVASCAASQKPLRNDQ